MGNGPSHRPAVRGAVEPGHGAAIDVEVLLTVPARASIAVAVEANPA